MKRQSKIWLFIFGSFSFLIVGCFPSVERFSNEERYYNDDQTVIIVESPPIFIAPIIIIDTQPEIERPIKHRNPPESRPVTAPVRERQDSYNQANRNPSNREGNNTVHKDNSRKRGER